jgi:hypothetical protein
MQVDRERGGVAGGKPVAQPLGDAGSGLVGGGIGLQLGQIGMGEELLIRNNANSRSPLCRDQETVLHVSKNTPTDDWQPAGVVVASRPLGRHACPGRCLGLWKSDEVFCMAIVAQ